MIRALKVQPLTVEAFAPFGQVLAYRVGDNPRRNFAAELFNDRGNARPNLRVQRTAPKALPLDVNLIERHRHSSQMFAPLSGGSYLVVVFPSAADGSPLVEEGFAFAAEGHQAINYRKDTWHHGFVALGGEGTFLMLRWEDGTAGDEEFLPLGEAVRVEG